MRTAFINKLVSLAEKDDRIFLLTGDLGFNLLERFADKFPERFINIGVAEQNMTGIAAGLALSGKIVFTYSIANFTTLRCLEQIRNDICYHNLNVNIVSVGCGLVYGPQGYTHHGIEDLAIMRVLPNMTVLAPGDPIETSLATEAMINYNGPSYLRLGNTNNPIHKTPPDFTLGKAICLREGKDVSLISTGEILQMTAQATDKLIKEGIDVHLISMPTMYPFDNDSISDAANKTGKILTIEEHGIGGLASATAEVLAQLSTRVNFIPMHLKREILKDIGNQEYLLSKHGITVDTIIKHTKDLVYGA